MKAALGCPLYTITAKRSMTRRPTAADFPVEDDTPETSGELPPILKDDLFEGGWEIEGIPGIDLILDAGEERPRIFSTILDLSGAEICLIRAGAGVWPE
ncbi:hypothetical protein FACS189445_0520 [Spirochaetia bacterium]|nr:hypothetical protein FACS189445_0520 [Spirochaetia bacterium]